MALQGIQLLFVPLPGSKVVLDSTSGTLITVLAVVVTVNAVNFVDGLDGLSAGMIGIAASAFFVFTYYLSTQHAPTNAATPTLLSAVLMGMCVGFLIHNSNPARIFMGDSGSMLIGLLLASSTTEGQNGGNVRSSAAAPARRPGLGPSTSTGSRRRCPQSGRPSPFRQRSVRRAPRPR